MAKTSAIERNKKREKLVARYAEKRRALKLTARDPSLSPEERFDARMTLAEMPRNSSAVRVRSRCLFSGRPRGVYSKFKLSRIALRDLASNGHIPGMVKSSW